MYYIMHALLTPCSMYYAVYCFLRMQHVLHHVMTPDAIRRVLRCVLLLSLAACITPCNDS